MSEAHESPIYENISNKSIETSFYDIEKPSIGISESLVERIETETETNKKDVVSEETGAVQNDRSISDEKIPLSPKVPDAEGDPDDSDSDQSNKENEKRAPNEELEVYLSH